MEHFVYSEQGLWQLHQHVTVHLRAIRDAYHALDFFLAGNKRLIYLLDFADVCPWMYERPEYSDMLMPESGHRYLLDNFFQSAGKLGIQLAMTPGARLELLESLQHLENRINHEVHSLLPKEILDAPMERLLAYMDIKDTSETDVIRKLQPLVANHKIEESIRKPARKITDLYRKGRIRNIESLVSASTLDAALALKDRSSYAALRREFKNHRRRKGLGDPSHDQFHDGIDVSNLQLAYDLIHSNEEGIYCPLTSMAYRTVSAGANVFRDNEADYPVVQPSLSPQLLFTILTLYGREGAKLHLGRAFNTLVELQKELSSIGVLKDLCRMPNAKRTEYLDGASGKKTVQLSRSATMLLRNYLEEVFSGLEVGHVDQSQQVSEGSERIDNVRDLVSKIQNAKLAPLDAVGALKALMGDTSRSPLFDIYVPDCKYVENLSNWIKLAPNPKG